MRLRQGIKFQKVKTEHTILPEFHSFLLMMEKNPKIERIIPGRISRQQKGSSELRFRVSYQTPTGIKCTMSKGSTAQELFVICGQNYKDDVEVYLRGFGNHSFD